jgi:hypothetical protein
MRFHHSNPLLLPLADSSSDSSQCNEDTIIGIFELTPPSPSPPAAITTVGLSPGKKRLLEQRHRLLSSSPDQKSSSEYVLKKSFLAPLKEVISHNEDLTEIRKISSIYMIPELKEFYSSCMETTAGNDEKEIIFKWRNFVLEGKPTELTSKSASNNISSNSPSSFSSQMKLNQFYCCQLLIFQNDKTHPIEVKNQGNDINNEETSNLSSENIEFIQTKETISINSISKTLVAAPPKEEEVVPLTHSDPPVEENIVSKGFSSLHRRSLTFSASLQQTARDLLGGKKENNGNSNTSNWILLPTGSRDENDLPVPSQIAEKSALSSFTTPEVEIPLTERSKVCSTMIPTQLTPRSSPSCFIISFLTKEKLFQSLREKLIHYYYPFIQQKMMKSTELDKNKKSKSVSEDLLLHSFNVLPLMNEKSKDESDSTSIHASSSLEKEFSFDIIEEILSLPVIVVLFFSLLMEMKILLVIDTSDQSIHSDDSLVVIIMEWLKDCLFPLQWEYPCLSLLVLEVVEELLECPTPYFVGISSATYQSLLSSSKISLSSREDNTNKECNSNKETKIQLHNIKNLIIVNLKSHEIIYPQPEEDEFSSLTCSFPTVNSSSSDSSKEIPFLQTLETHCLKSVSINPEDNSCMNVKSKKNCYFPLLSILQSIYFPLLSSFSFQSAVSSFSSSTSPTLPLDQSSPIFQHATSLPTVSSSNTSSHNSLTAEDEISYFPPELFSNQHRYGEFFLTKDNRNLSKSHRVSRFFKLFINELLSNWQYCSLPFYSSSSTPPVVDKILFDEKLFLSLKLQQSVQKNSLLSLPEQSIFIKSFLHSQSFSAFLSNHSNSLPSSLFPLSEK